MNNSTQLSDLLVHFGENVRLRRQYLQLSQEKLAALAGLHRTYIGMIERAEKNITLTNAERIAVALGCDLRELIDATRQI
jgi:transcriptional regulator with XRE-family HTH domain